MTFEPWVATKKINIALVMSEAQDQSGDVAAVWDIKLADGVHKIVFEHGTTSGKRVISVDGEEVKLAAHCHLNSWP